MIITLRDTTASQVAGRLNAERQARGSGALGRVLTLIVVVRAMIDVDQAIEISEAASREHPCRVLVVVDAGATEGDPLLNAQVRVGGEAGASEIVVLEPRGGAATSLDTLVAPLLLSDTPVVAFWPNTPPANPSAHPLGRIAARRITDARSCAHPVRSLLRLADVYAPGDSDLAWAGVTLWRALLATVLGGEDAAVPAHLAVSGNPAHPAPYLIAAWLHRQLGVPLEFVRDSRVATVAGVRASYPGGREVALVRHAGSPVAHLTRSGVQPTEVNLPRRSVQDCLMEELRRLDPDHYYGHILTEDLPAIARGRAAPAQATPRTAAPRGK